jgi:uncharacterized membrane protein
MSIELILGGIGTAVVMLILGIIGWATLNKTFLMEGINASQP